MLQLGYVCAGHMTDHSRRLPGGTKSIEDYQSSSYKITMPTSISIPPNDDFQSTDAPKVSKDKCRTTLRLPCFKMLGISPIAYPNINTTGVNSDPPVPDPAVIDSQNRALTTGYGGTPLLTPPLDGSTTQGLPNKIPWNMASNSISSSPAGAMSATDSGHAGPAIERQTIGLDVHNSNLFIDQTHSQGGPWITRASQRICSLLNDSSMFHQIQLISQTMPSQAKDGDSKPTFEAILETVQTGLNVEPYITITHAVPQACVMEELPKTPPATPNSRHELNDYFGNDQTIFTHAAVVPIYHKYGRVAQSSTLQLPHHIAAPYSIQISVLERYIPPTMPSEITDFFSISNKSYLVDRLSELSANNGSLLLIYPTRAGGETFQRAYINRVLDPLLRQFILLNNLTTNAATMMGNMAAVEKMMDFESMKTTLDSICQNLTERPAVRGQKSKYRTMHSEVAQVTLDRTVWTNWYIEQEQPRLRQNLNFYHQSGGRMPNALGHQEITTGMLTREIINGIRKSQEVAGATGIEVGVFVITRSTS